VSEEDLADSPPKASAYKSFSKANDLIVASSKTFQGSLSTFLH